MIAEMRLARLSQMRDTGKLFIVYSLIVDVLNSEPHPAVAILLISGILLYLYGRIRATLIGRSEEGGKDKKLRQFIRELLKERELTPREVGQIVQAELSDYREKMLEADYHRDNP